MALDITPVEGMVALQIVDDEDETEREQRLASRNTNAPSDSYNEAIVAIVVALGPNSKSAMGPKIPTGVKKGSTVLVRKYARDGLRIDDDTVLVETYCIVALVGG